MTEPLPDLVVKFKGDISDIASDIAEVKALLASLGDTAKKTSKDTEDSFKKSGSAAKDYERLVQGNLRDEESAWKTVQREISNYQTKIKTLRSDLKSTGSSGVFGDLKSAESDLKKLTSFAEDMAPGFSKAGAQAGTGFVSSLSSAIDDAGPLGLAVKGVLIAGALAAAPLIIALINGAIVTAFGLGGVAIGIAAALRDPRVKSELSSLKGEFSSVFSSIGQPFILPLLGALHQFGADLSVLGPDITRAFAPLAEAIAPLEEGISGFIQDALPGLSEGFANITPDIQYLAKLLPGLGQSIGDFFATITRNGPAVRMTITTLVGAIEMLTGWFGKVLATSTTWYAQFLQMMVHILNATGDVLDVASKIPGVGAGLDGVASKLHSTADAVQQNIDKATAGVSANDDLTSSYGALADQTQRNVKSLKELIGEYETWRGKVAGVRDANLQAHESLTEFQDALKKGKVSWDINTAAGQGFLEKLNAVDDANNAYFQSLNSITPQTVGDYLAQEQSLYKMAKAAGAPASALATLKDEIKKLRAQLDALNGKTVNFKIVGHQYYVGNAGPQAVAQGGTPHYAQGGVDYAGARAFAQSGVAGQVREFAQPGVYSGGLGSLIKFAEPSTGGEAYISRNGNRGKQLSTINTALSWMSERSPLNTSSTTNVGVATGSGAPIVINVNSILDGKVVARSQIKHNQNQKLRSGTSGQS